jgi:hypothetical protein
MGTFCANAGQINSDVQANQTFMNTIIPTIANADRISSGDLKGRLTAVKLQSIYDTLTANNTYLVSTDSYKRELARIANSPTQVDAQAILNNLSQKESESMGKIQEEFCFYYIRYKYTLDTLFQKLVEQAPQAEIQTRLNTAKALNERLNDLVQITNFIAQQRAREMRQQNTEINAINQNLSATFEVLQGHRRLLNSETSLQDIRKRMVEFTEEKNRSAMNLLSLFGFLNLVAIGLLVYVARS